MLSQLAIKNFGLIDHIELAFCSTLNILTGETGAGKSIIIDGLRFALGERLRSSQIRDENMPGVVEAVFELKPGLIKQSEVFKEFISMDDCLLVIHREAYADGRTRIKVNGNNVTVSQLKVLGNHLLDLHGPYDHQMLLAEDYHLEMLDRLVNFGEARQKYETLFKSYVALTLQINELKELAANRERELDLLIHQIKELEQVPLDQQFYDEFIQKHVRMRNTERLAEAASSLLDLLEHEEIGATESIRKAFPFCHTLTQIDETTRSFEEQLDHIQENVQQLTTDLRNYLSSLEFEPGEAESMNRKFDIYENIHRKYGPTLEEAKKFYERSKERYHLLADLEHNDAELRQQREKTEKELAVLSKKLTDIRKTAAVSLKKTIEIELHDLGIEHVEFEVRFEKTEFHKDGVDKVVFFISPNAGEELKPLAEIVSSGEAARLMLALKKALTKVDPIPTLVFDEIDAQIGGRLGTITGQKLKQLAADRQILLITHLPQIAVFGEKHYKVTKVVRKGRTFTDVVELSGDDRIAELAQMMGGKKQSGLSVDHARDMLDRGQNS
ncbi:MAG: DNA repair protein RecN [Candidatus Omnitrophota bacterium]